MQESKLQETEETDVRKGAAQDTDVQVGRSTALMSALVVVSRVTGFVRTWAQAWALGATVLASCYEVANNLPTQIYELVTAGMLVTAFLPVYVSVKKRLGQEGANDYASNLVSIVTLITGIITLISVVFAAQIIWTQSFGATEEFDFDRATWFFRFFAIEIVLYALSTIYSGVVNAERDYFWSYAAPIFNNLVVTASFVGYGLLSDVNPALALVILALGNPLGVLMQVLLQIPPMRRHGVHLRWRIDLSDPALKDTLQIGVPSIVTLVAAFVTSSFQTSAVLSVTAIGASLAYYAHLWYILPYSVLAVPITTALFTELSDLYAQGDLDAFRKTIATGTSRILFFLVPFSFYLVVFAEPLLTIDTFGNVGAEAIALAVVYLCGRVPSLSVYGIGMYLQKVCSATRKMGVYAMSTIVGSVVQVVLLQTLTPYLGLWFVPFTSFIFYLVFDLIIFAALRRDLGALGIGEMIRGLARSLAIGFAGALLGWAIQGALSLVLGPIDGSVLQAFLRCVAGGIPALVVTYGLALLLHMPEAASLNALLARFRRR